MAAEVLVVGGTSGLGYELAKTYRSRGANVTITGRDEGKTGAVAADCGDGVRSIALDLAEPQGIAEALADLERIDRLALLAVDRDQNTVTDYDVDRRSASSPSSSSATPRSSTSSRAGLAPDASILLFGGLAKDRPYPGSTTVTTVNGAVATMIRTTGARARAACASTPSTPGIVADTPYWGGKDEHSRTSAPERRRGRNCHDARTSSTRRSSCSRTQR